MARGFDKGTPAWMRGFLGAGTPTPNAVGPQATIAALYASGPTVDEVKAAVGDDSSLAAAALAAEQAQAKPRTTLVAWLAERG